jgi:CopG family transcriptional regulator, nickel-responsive regulator
MLGLVRAGILETQHNAHRAPECVASVVYVYDQGTRELPKRLAHDYPEHHDLSVATLRVALDHDACMEVAVLKGKTADVGAACRAHHCLARRTSQAHSHYSCRD